MLKVDQKAYPKRKKNLRVPSKHKPRKTRFGRRIRKRPMRRWYRGRRWRFRIKKFKRRLVSLSKIMYLRRFKKNYKYKLILRQGLRKILGIMPNHKLQAALHVRPPIRSSVMRDIAAIAHLNRTLCLYANELEISRKVWEVKQYIKAGYFLVNGFAEKDPFYTVRVGDSVSVKKWYFRRICRWYPALKKVFFRRFRRKRWMVPKEKFLRHNRTYIVHRLSPFSITFEYAAHPCREFWPFKREYARFMLANVLR